MLRVVDLVSVVMIVVVVMICLCVCVCVCVCVRRMCDLQEDLSENQVVKLVNKFVKSTDRYDGDKFFTTVDGVRVRVCMCK